MSEKAKAAADIMGKIEDPCQQTVEQVPNLADLKNRVVTGRDNSQPHIDGPSPTIELADPRSHGVMDPPPSVFTKSVRNRSGIVAQTVMARPKSIDISSTRQINNRSFSNDKMNLKLVSASRVISKFKQSAKRANIKPFPHKSTKARTFTQHVAETLSLSDSTQTTNFKRFPDILKCSSLLEYEPCVEIPADNQPISKQESFEFAGHSSDEQDNSFEFEGDSSDDKEETETNFFEGHSDDESFDSIDFFEPTNEENDDQYNFESTEKVCVEPYKPLMRSNIEKKDDNIDFSDPLQLIRPDGLHCSRYCENKCGKLNKCLSFVCEMRGIKGKFDELNRQEKRNHLLDQLAYQDQFGLAVNVFFVKSEPLCLQFFSSVSGVSTRVLSSVVKDYSNGVHRYTNDHGRQKMSSQMLKFISWAVSYVKLHGEHSPDDKGVISLPSWLTKAKLYEKYSDTVGKQRLALSTFYQALGSRFGRERDDVSLPCIVIPKDSEHCKCNECLAYKKFKRTAKTELQLSVADKLLQNHLDICARERMRVWCLFQRCVDFKYENLGIQFDDMDQTKTNVPKFAERSKSLQNFNQLKNHCTGVIVHSGLYPENRSVHFYLNQDQFEQGGSKSVTIIHDVLMKHVEAHGFLPPHLHIRKLAFIFCSILGT